MYFEAKSLVKIATEKIAEFDENQKELDEELQDIYKQIPQLGTKAYDFTEETN
jgi:prefoldin subunit 5